jgi:hypothetical protein
MKKTGRPKGPTATYVKTLVSLPRDLRRRVTRVATRRGVAFRQITEDALEAYLKEDHADL